MKEIVLYESSADGDSLMGLLPACGCRGVKVTTTETLLEAVSHLRPAVVLFALEHDSRDDLVAMHLLRRVAPDLPLVVVASEATLEVRRTVQMLRPVYFAVRPVEAPELHEALCAACPERVAREMPAAHPPRLRTRAAKAAGQKS